MAQKAKFNDPALKDEIIQWMLDKLNEDGMNKTKVIAAALAELKSRGIKNPPSEAALRSWLPVISRRGAASGSSSKRLAQGGKMDIGAIKRQMESFRDQALAALRAKAETIATLQSELDVEIEECADLFGVSIDEVRAEIE